jgi:hypothetical protein
MAMKSILVAIIILAGAAVLLMLDARSNRPREKVKASTMHFVPRKPPDMRHY